MLTTLSSGLMEGIDMPHVLPYLSVAASHVSVCLNSALSTGGSWCKAQNTFAANSSAKQQQSGLTSGVTQRIYTRKESDLVYTHGSKIIYYFTFSAEGKTVGELLEERVRRVLGANNPLAHGECLESEAK